jgi:hypothetical protein
MPSGAKHHKSYPPLWRAVVGGVDQRKTAGITGTLKLVLNRAENAPDVAVFVSGGDQPLNVLKEN